MTPMDEAWTILKRQTALSEYEGFEELEDMPVPNKPQKIGIPTHINRELYPIHENAINYNLMSGDTKLGNISTNSDKNIRHFAAEIKPEYRRQGLYQKLLNALIQNNKGIISDDRNKYSHPAHKKFQENLPDNVAFYSPPEANRLEEGQTFDYQKKPSEMIGGIQRYDYGSLPIRDVENSEMIEYQNKPIHERMRPSSSDPENPYRQFMRLNEFSE